MIKVIKAPIVELDIMITSFFFIIDFFLNIYFRFLYQNFYKTILPSIKMIELCVSDLSIFQYQNF